MDAFAVDGSNASEGGGSGEDAEDTEDAKELIFSGTVPNTDDPLVIVNNVDSDENEGNDLYVIWKSEAFLRQFKPKLFKCRDLSG